MRSRKTGQADKALSEAGTYRGTEGREFSGMTSGSKWRGAGLSGGEGEFSTTRPRNWRGGGRSDGVEH